MSRDIRSFFSVKNPKNGQQNSLNKPSKTIVQKPGHKKRSLVIIDSDSEEELLTVNPKRSKPSIEDKKNNKKPETKSKYFECNNVSLEDIFGNEPVKRDTSRKIIKKTVTKEEKGSNFDKDFEAELPKLNDTWSDIDSREGESKVNEGSNFNSGGKFSKKTESEVAHNNIWKSPRKKKFDSDFSESPRKKLKLEDKEDFASAVSETLEDGNKQETLVNCKKESPVKNKYSVSQTSSPHKRTAKGSPLNKSPIKNGILKTPEKSPFKKLFLTRMKKEILTLVNCKKESPVKNKYSLSPSSSPRKRTAKGSPLNKSPIKNGVLKTPEKSPFKKLSLTRTIKEILTNKDSSKLNGGLLHAKNSDYSKIEKSSKIQLVKDPSPKKAVVEKELFNKDRHEKKTDLTVKGITDRTEKRKESPQSISAEGSQTLAPCNLWVERYKPTITKQIIGQQGEKSCVNKLITWLKKWEANHSGTKKLVKPSPWAKNDDGAFFKAALLSGPPGVGKTTTAHLVCKELGFDVVEFNASDTRSKKLLHQEVSELLSTKSLSPFFTGKGNQVTKKHVLVMDEVDGMAGNEDRGGVQELITLIKQSRIPVICMCNDRNHPKIRSLANYCFDLRFSKPRVEQIRGAMMSMCFKEKLKLKPDEVTDIITSANQDIRLIINHLSMLSLEKTSMANSSKHIKLGPWDIVRKIFSEQDHKSMSIYDKCDLFFHDYSVTPLFVQENYLNAVPHKPEGKNKIKKMALFAKAAQSLSFGDLTEKRIHTNNAWGLLPVQAVFSSLVPGEVLEGHLGAQINFPAWFGKNSRQTKMNRLVQELTVHSRLKISGNREAMNLDYLSSLERAITTPLSHDGVDGVADALAVLSEYCLVREDMESIAELSAWPGSKNSFAQVDSKVKAAFTRAYNKTSAPTPYASVPVKKGRGDIELSDGLGEEENNTQDMEEEEEEGLETDAMIMVKKKPAGKKADKDLQPSSSKGSKASKRGRKK